MNFLAWRCSYFLSYGRPDIYLFCVNVKRCLRGTWDSDLLTWPNIIHMVEAPSCGNREILISHCCRYISRAYLARGRVTRTTMWVLRFFLLGTILFRLGLGWTRTKCHLLHAVEGVALKYNKIIGGLFYFCKCVWLFYH